MLPQIEQVWEDVFWQFLTVVKIDLLRLKVGPLLRYAPDVDVAKATFTHKVERLKLQVLTGRDTADLTAIDRRGRQPLARLRARSARAGRRDRLLSLAGFGLSRHADELDQVIDTLAGQMRYRKAADSAFLMLDLPDFIATRGYILLFGGSQEMYVESYRQLVEERVLDLAANHPTVRGDRARPARSATSSCWRWSARCATSWAFPAWS